MPLIDKIEDSLPAILKSKFSKDPAVMMSKLPADNPMKAKLQSKIEEIKASESNLDNYESDAFRVFDDDSSNYLKSFDNYLSLLELDVGNLDPSSLDNVKQISHLLSNDAKIELAWLATWNDKPQFQEYIKGLILHKSKLQMRDLMLMVGVVSSYIDRDKGVLDQVKSNQEYTYASMQKWEEYLDEQLTEKDGLYKKLSGMHSTQQRESLFNIEDIKRLTKWKGRVDVAFAICMFFLIVVICTKFYSAQIRAMVDKQAKALMSTMK